MGARTLVSVFCKSEHVIQCLLGQKITVRVIFKHQKLFWVMVLEADRSKNTCISQELSRCVIAMMGAQVRMRKAVKSAQGQPRNRSNLLAP